MENASIHSRAGFIDEGPSIAISKLSFFKAVPIISVSEFKIFSFLMFFSSSALILVFFT